MAKPVPQDQKEDRAAGGDRFGALVDGRARGALITFEALDVLLPDIRSSARWIS